ncbi:Purple acid Phosphatase, N-terminal domain [Filimonas lacunae]|uniref:Purple acid Phosphatase, N-terminal domain n=1 Tax=Filimonas lacunae TaxID=477680 RepID=A0A173MK64_9BACT|nr:metallophosphoesterase family protein [Filimonas lacunae]BAV07859.1 acid phosphatase [Filimonas lacunae]SIT05729.1 Purple acid Phosphatase, N-terminal domain [Filimonas lacunae]
MNKQVAWLAAVLLALNVQAYAQQEDNPDAVPAVVRGPYLQVATANSITIRWRTDVATRSRVQYGVQEGKTKWAKDDSVLTAEHVVTINGLQPHTRYYYTIGDFKRTMQGDAANYFCTLPETGKEGIYRIGAFGDCGNNSVNQRKVKQSVLNYLGNNYMDAWILLGDNAYGSGTDAEFQAKFFNIYKDDLLKKYPLFPCPGNHDYNDKDFPGAVETAIRTHQTAYYNNFSMPLQGESGGVPSHTQAFYSFDIGNVHFLSLDSEGLEDGESHIYDTLGAQAQWVKRDLAANRHKQWVVAYWHHPPYTMGSHNSDKAEELILIRKNFLAILERYGVDLVLCGHSHDYERSRLLKGHYGMSATFRAAEHNVSGSTGLYDGSRNSCPYVKDTANTGTVYVVAGSAGQLGGRQATYPHKAMLYANDSVGGAGMIEVQGNRLDFKWICADGVIRDQFTMMKEVNKQVTMQAKAGRKVTLTASFSGNYQWSEKGLTSRSITIEAPKGTTVYTVQDKESCIKDTFTVIGE